MTAPKFTFHRAQTDATTAIVRRWQLILVALAFAIPVAEEIGVWLIETYPDNILGRCT